MNAMVKTDAIVGAPQHPASEMATFLICKIYLIYNLYSLYSSNVLYLVYKSTPWSRIDPLTSQELAFKTIIYLQQIHPIGHIIVYP